MSLVNTFETDLLELIFNNTAIADVGTAAGLQPSATANDIYISLHTADPGEAAANQSVSEATYTGYSATGRQAAPRSGSGWTVSGDTVDNAAAETFGENTGASQTITDFGLGFAVSGATTLYLVGTADLVVGTNVIPEFAIGALDVTLN